LKKQSSVFISQNKVLLALATLCSSFVIILCYSHVGVMTFLEGEELNLKKLSISYLLYILRSFLLLHSTFLFYLFFYIRARGYIGILEWSDK